MYNIDEQHWLTTMTTNNIDSLSLSFSLSLSLSLSFIFVSLWKIERMLRNLFNICNDSEYIDLNLQILLADNIVRDLHVYTSLVRTVISLECS